MQLPHPHLQLSFIEWCKMHFVSLSTYCFTKCASTLLSSGFQRSWHFLSFTNLWLPLPLSASPILLLQSHSYIHTHLSLPLPSFDLCVCMCICVCVYLSVPKIGHSTGCGCSAVLFCFVDYLRALQTITPDWLMTDGHEWYEFTLANFDLSVIIFFPSKKTCITCLCVYPVMYAFITIFTHLSLSLFKKFRRTNFKCCVHVYVHFNHLHATFRHPHHLNNALITDDSSRHPPPCWFFLHPHHFKFNNLFIYNIETCNSFVQIKFNYLLNVFVCPFIKNQNELNVSTVC